MCFIVDCPAKQAEKDILCFKVMSIDNKGRLNSLHYPSPKGYNLEDSIYGSGFYHGHPRRFAKHLSKQVDLNGEVVHSYRSLITARNLRNACDFSLFGTYIVVQCIIPKGTWYWENQDGEYASFELRLSEFDLCVTFSHKW